MAHSDSLTADEARHLLRRFSFAATSPLAESLTGLDPATAFAKMWEISDSAPTELPELPREMSIAHVRQQWLAHMASSPAGLRENLMVFFHGLFGSSTTSVKNAQAHADRNAVLRRTIMTSVPAVLEQMISNPAMMLQIGMQGHTLDRVSDRPAKLVLDHWTMGAGAYPDPLVEEVSRTLTGWTVRRSDVGTDDPLALERGPLVGVFNAASFDAEPKTLFGATGNFDARAAVRNLALQPATAARISQKLIRHFGVADVGQVLQRRLEATYSATHGSMRALLADIATSRSFWSPQSRWSLIKSPVHLAIGACRQLGLQPIPVAALETWLSRCGQTLFDTPNNGEGGWADQQAWITPSDRLALRYGLFDALCGDALSIGFVPPTKEARSRAADALVPVDSESASSVIARLDPAPGLDRRALQSAKGAQVAARVIATPQYQLA